METYEIIEVKNGWLLVGNSKKYLIGIAQHPPAKYYLQQLEPSPQFITGLFEEPKKNLFRGKDKNGKKINIKIVGSSAILNED